MRLPIFLLAVAASAPVWIGSANAAEIYRWVDDDGVLHYSDSRPEEGTEVDTIQVQDSSAQDYDPSADAYSIVNQARRMTQTWMELAAAREERMAQRRKVAQTDQGAAPAVYDHYTYWPRIGYFSSVYPGRLPHARPAAAGGQIRALKELELAGARPQSINSGTHHARVLRSRSLPLVTPKRAPRP